MILADSNAQQLWRCTAFGHVALTYYRTNAAGTEAWVEMRAANDFTTFEPWSDSVRVSAIVRLPPPATPSGGRPLLDYMSLTATDASSFSATGGPFFVSAYTNDEPVPPPFVTHSYVQAALAHFVP